MSGEVRTERGKADPGLLAYLFYGKTGLYIEGNCTQLYFSLVSCLIPRCSFNFRLPFFMGYLIGVGNRQVYKFLILYIEAKE